MVERAVHRLGGSILAWSLVLTGLALYASAPLRLWLPYGKPIEPWQVFWPLPMYLAVTAIWSLAFMLFRPQRALFFSNLLDTVSRLIGAVGFAALALAGLLFLSYREISRLQFLYFVGLDLLILLLLYYGIRWYSSLGGAGRNHKRVLLVGSGPAAGMLVDELARRPWVGMQVLGCTSDLPVEDPRLLVLGPIADTVSLVREHQIDEVIFLISEEAQLAPIALQLLQYPVMLHMVPRLVDLVFARTPVELLGGVPVVGLRESALTEPQWLLKRLFDLVVSGLLLLLLAPLMLLVALAIKLDSPGPVLLLQERIGAHGRRFKMLKFRTMYQDAEQRRQQVSRHDADGQPLHKTRDDPRVTRIGRRLRRLSLDELPQLINVLRGEMSLVGPRPEMPYITSGYESWQWQRFRVPPGMTGWWQVNGRSERPMHLHTQDDLYYIQNYSFWLDLKILWRTLSAVIKGQGAF